MHIIIVASKMHTPTSYPPEISIWGSKWRSEYCSHFLSPDKTPQPLLSLTEHSKWEPTFFQTPKLSFLTSSGSLRQFKSTTYVLLFVQRRLWQILRLIHFRIEQNLNHFFSRILHKVLTIIRAKINMTTHITHWLIIMHMHVTRYHYLHVNSHSSHNTSR